jgi:hypothetical protein
MRTVSGLNVPHRQVTAAAPAVGARYHSVTVLLSLWMIIGVFIDGWSHGQTKTESFFSPWHAVVYSGFLAVAYWVASPTARSRDYRQSVPAGYAPGLIGIGMIATGAICDNLWHAAFGFEQGTEVLMSPPHFLLVTGMALVVSSPFRAAWASAESEPVPTFRGFLTPLTSLMLAVSVVMLIFFPLWGLGNGRIITPGGVERVLAEFAPASDGRARVLDAAQQWAIGNVLITNWTLLAPVLLIVKRWRPPFGTVTFLFFGTSFLMASLTGFLYRSVLLPPLLAGVVADILIAAWWPLRAHATKLRAFAALVPAALWAMHFLATWLQWGLAWGPAMWLGVICWSAAGGVALSLLVFPTVGVPADS